MQVADANRESGRLPPRNGRVLPSIGIAWRFQLPESLLGRATLNALEFLAAFVGVLVEFGCGAEWTDADMILSQGDSVSATKWLASSSFDDNCPMHLAIARSFADFCLSKGINHYTQWFPGRRTQWPTLSLGILRCPTKRSQS